MPAPRSKRYESEYLSRYKQFESRRPNTVKGEVMRSLSNTANDNNGSSPRAGLLSSQLGTIHEPPLQRKRIVPYEKNHNIFTTVTVKEQPDREWLKTDRESNRSYSPVDGRRKEEKSKTDAVVNRSETPILAAERKIFKEKPRNTMRTVYIPDRIKRRSTYKGDFVDYKKQSNTSKQRRPKRKPKQQPSPHKVVGGSKGEVSPDRLPPAGIRSATSIGDARLLKPSDESQYLRSPEPEQKVFKTEYASHYRQPTKFKYVNGLWIEVPVNSSATYNAMDDKNNKNKAPDWFTQVLQRRKEAYGYSKHARGTHFSRENLDEMKREQAERTSSRSESHRSDSPPDERSRRPEINPRTRTRTDSPPRRREAWSEVHTRSPREAEDRQMGSGTEATSDNDEMLLERGRSPTPELRDIRRSRRHHLDVTTDVLNDSFEKSLSISKKKNQGGSPIPPKEVRDLRPASPTSSIGLGDDAGSYNYTPPRKAHERSPPDPRGVSPVTGQGGGINRTDDDVLSVSAMSSRASTASETLERARKRRDDFWKKENAPR